MELRDVLFLAAGLLPAVVIAAPAEQAQRVLNLQAVSQPGASAPTSEQPPQHQHQHQRKLHGRFLHITDFHPDSHYKTHTSTAEGDACHSGKGPAGFYGAETSDCDTPHALVNATFDWIETHLKDSIDFVIWTGDSARHDSDETFGRSEKEVVNSNRLIADKFVSTLSDRGGLSIPVIPTFGNNDILPHNIMVGGPNKWLKWYTDIWKSFIPEAQMHTFEQGGWFFTEVVPNKLAVFSLNTLYFFDRNAGIEDCTHPSEPGFKQMEWLRIQLQFLRNRGMKAILMGHVPPARTAGKQNWDETCWQKYTLWLQQFRDVIVGGLYGHMNIDHFFLQDTRDINLNYLEKGTKEYEKHVRDKKKKHRKKHRKNQAANIQQDGFSIWSGADYLSELRDDWAKLPKAAVRTISGSDVEAEKKKKKKKKDPLGGEWAERYQLSMVSPSIVPNYFPTIRVFEYNITGMEDSPTWADVIRDSKPGRQSVGVEENGQQHPLDGILDEDPEFDIDKKKHKKKKGKKGKKPKDPYLIVPEPPSSTAGPGPAYSPQPLTLTGYTQYYANLTYLNNDAHDFTKKLKGFEEELSAERWNEGVHKGKKPGHKPKPRPFEFQVEYSTFNDTLYKVKDLTVGSFVELAYRIGHVKTKSKAMIDGTEDTEVEEPHEDDTLDVDTDKSEDDDVDDSDDDDSELETEKHGNKKGKKGKKGKKKKNKKKKHNEVWLHFLEHAFVSTMPKKDLKKL
ncbi:hypothetical protein JX266_006612 [Neoarthrinium moseri]|nr:hypothetical protein JX266_006612 [Neoarthrinium moseri]